MNRKLIAAVVSGALVLPVAALAQDEEAMEVPEHSHPSVLEHEHELGEGEEMMMAPMHGHSYASHPAAAHEHDASHGHSATVYGTLRYGVTVSDDDMAGSSTKTGIGDDYGTRFGIKGTASAGAGLTAGFQLERGYDGLTPRHHNVSLSGAFGTVTLGQHGSPYYSAVTWDGSAHLGGVTDFGLRRQGVSYASALGGPFDFKVFTTDGGDKGGADHVEVTGSFAAGPLSLSAGYMEEAAGGERIGGSVKGGAANITLHVGYEAATDVECAAETEKSTGAAHGMPNDHLHTVTAAMSAKYCDEDRFGFNLSYLLGAGPGGGNVYVQYGERASDDAYAEKRDVDYWALGYSYYVSEAVTVNVVHRTQDGYNKVAKQRLTDRTSAVVLKVDF